MATNWPIARGALTADVVLIGAFQIITVSVSP